jgi:hypothetical protein
MIYPTEVYDVACTANDGNPVNNVSQLAPEAIAGNAIPFQINHSKQWLAPAYLLVRLQDDLFEPRNE